MNADKAKPIVRTVLHLDRRLSAFIGVKIPFFDF